MSDARVEAAADAIDNVPSNITDIRAQRIAEATAALAAADRVSLAGAEAAVKEAAHLLRCITVYHDDVADNYAIQSGIQALAMQAAALAGLAGQVARLRECITVIEARATGREAAGGTRVDYQDCLRGCGEIARAALQELPDAT